MRLDEAESERRLKIFEIESTLDIKKKLSRLGIQKNDSLCKLNETKWGPILIQNLSAHSSKLALGRELAEKIIVEYES